MTRREVEVFVAVGSSREKTTIKQIQEILQVSPRTLSMALTDLRKKGLVSRQRRNYAITNGENDKGLQLYKAIEGRVKPTSEFHL